MPLESASPVVVTLSCTLSDIHFIYLFICFVLLDALSQVAAQDVYLASECQGFARLWDHFTNTFHVFNKLT